MGGTVLCGPRTYREIAFQIGLKIGGVIVDVLKMSRQYNDLLKGSGGWGGIRTHEGLAPLPVFKTGAFNRSATHPHRDIISPLARIQGGNARQRLFD